MENTSQPRVSPFCSALSSKKVMVEGSMPMTPEDVLDASNHCWCEETQQILGPDREVASPAACRKGRSCFRSAFQSML